MMMMLEMMMMLMMMMIMMMIDHIYDRISEYMVNLFGEPDPLPSCALSAKDIDTGEVEGEGGLSDNPFPEAEIDDMRAVRDAALTRFIQVSLCL